MWEVATPMSQCKNGYFSMNITNRVHEESAPRNLYKVVSTTYNKFGKTTLNNNDRSMPTKEPFVTLYKGLVPYIKECLTCLFSFKRKRLFLPLSASLVLVNVIEWRQMPLCMVDALRPPYMRVNNHIA